MTVHLWDQKLSYISVPKCGCTSLKLYFHEVIHTAKVPEETARRVHQELRTRAFVLLPHYKIRHHTKITVVREPVARIVSAYQSKVVNENCLSKSRAAALLGPLGLSAEPSLSEFLRRIRTYMCVSPVIFRHFQKLSYYLGRRADWFTQIYDLSQVSTLREYINQRMGSSAELPFVNRSGVQCSGVSVSAADRARILTLYHDDVTQFGRHFAIPATAG